MSARKSRRCGRVFRATILAAAGLAVGAIGGAGATPGFYHDGYARGRADEPSLARYARGRADEPLAPASAAGLELSASWLAAAGAGDPASGSPAPSAARASMPRRLTPAKTIGASLLFPGWGQYLTGHKGRATAFLVAEVSLIAAWIGFRVQGEVRQDRYGDYAELFAAVQDARDKSDGYYRNLGRYRSTADYVDDLARDARARFGDDIAQREAYVAARRPSADEAWQWASQAHRETFVEMRKASRSAFHRADQMIGVILLNHVLSAVDAGRLSRQGSSGRALYVRPGSDGTSYLGLVWPLDE